MDLGMHFRLTDDEVAPLLAAAGYDAIHSAVAAIEETPDLYDRGCDSEKAWDPITCALAPEEENSSWPARGVIGGARALLDDDDAGWVTHCSPAEVAEVAAYLDQLTDDEFAHAYDAMPEDLRNPEYGDDEKQYALDTLTELRAFFAAASSNGEHVVFSVWF